VVHVGAENNITATKVFLAVKALKAGHTAGYDKVRGSSWTESCVSIVLAFWKGTERLASLG